MFLVTYPISAFDEQLINHPTSAFHNFDTTNREESLKVFLMLLAQFGNTLEYYNMSSRSSSSHFENIDDLIDDINCQEIDFENNWYVLLNIEEQDVINILDGYKRDFVIIDGGTNKPLRFNADHEIIVYGSFEMAMIDMKENEKLHCLLSIVDQSEKDKCIVHDFSMEYENITEVGTFKSSAKSADQWFYDASDYFEPKVEVPKNPYEDRQVTLKIQTNYGFTADFLRELANQIEEEGEELTTYEAFRGCAEIDWDE